MVSGMVLGLYSCGTHLDGDQVLHMGVELWVDGSHLQQWLCGVSFQEVMTLTANLKVRR